jgi:hypothetical protein
MPLGLCLAASLGGASAQEDRSPAQASGDSVGYVVPGFTYSRDTYVPSLGFSGTLGLYSGEVFLPVTVARDLNNRTRWNVSWWSLLPLGVSVVAGVFHEGEPFLWMRDILTYGIGGPLLLLNSQHHLSLIGPTGLLDSQSFRTSVFAGWRTDCFTRDDVTWVRWSPMVGVQQGLRIARAEETDLTTWLSFSGGVEWPIDGEPGDHTLPSSWFVSAKLSLPAFVSHPSAPEKSSGSEPSLTRPPEPGPSPPEHAVVPHAGASVEPQPVGVHMHDGFFLSVGIGAMAGSYDEAVSGSGPDAGRTLTFSGGGPLIDLRCGGTIAENLILSGDIAARGLIQPGVETSGTPLPPADDPAVTEALVGVGLTYYFMPENFFVSGTFGLSQISMEYTRAGTPVTVDSTDMGFGLSLRVGKEWWVGEQWALGIAAAGGWMTLANDEAGRRQKLSGYSFGLTLTATYQ